MRDNYPAYMNSFTNLNFQQLWKGREKVIAVERALLAALLKKTGNRRTLEIGTGNGRLSDIIGSTSFEYVGTDINPVFLRDLRKLSGLRKSRLLASNLYSLPFRNNSFDTVVMIRVFNFLSDPGMALREISRVLIPGGSLILSYSPRPSLATLVDDIKFSVSFSEKKTVLKDFWKPVTFSKKDFVRLEPAQFPTFSMSNNYFNSIMAKANLTRAACLSSGLEDYKFMENLPLDFFLKLAFGFRRLPLMPTRFILAMKPQGKGSLIQDLDDIFCCPRCNSPLELGEEILNIRCNICLFNTEGREGFPDLRYFPGADVIS